MSVFIGAIVRNEQRDIREWVLHHQAIGVEHIWLYDNQSMNGYQEQLGDLMRDGYVEMVSWPGNYMFRQHAQMCDMCFNREWGDNDWGAFIDADEFIHFDRHKNIQDFLDDYREFAGLTLSWVTHGANGHLTRPNLPLQEAYDRPVPLIRPNHNFKSIVKFGNVGFWNDVHRFTPKKGKCLVNVCREVVYDSWLEQRLDGAHLKHYVTKSWEEFVERLERGNITPGCRNIETFFRYNEDMRDQQEELVHELDIDKFPTLCFAREMQDMLAVFFQSDIYVRLSDAFDSKLSDDAFRNVCLSELKNFFTFHFNNLKQRPPRELAMIEEKCRDMLHMQSEFIMGMPRNITDYRRALIEAIINTPFHRNVVPLGEM